MCLYKYFHAYGIWFADQGESLFLTHSDPCGDTAPTFIGTQAGVHHGRTTTGRIPFYLTGNTKSCTCILSQLPASSNNDLFPQSIQPRGQRNRDIAQGIRSLFETHESPTEAQVKKLQTDVGNAVVFLRAQRTYKVMSKVAIFIIQNFRNPSK